MMMVHRVLLVQRVVSYLLETGVVVLILKLCVVMMESTVVLKVCLFLIDVLGQTKSLHSVF